MADEIAAELDSCLALHQGGELAAAEEAYRHLLARHPDEPELLHLFGLLRAQQGFLDEALGYLDKAVATRPDVPLYQFNLATVSLEAGIHEAAVAAFSRCRDLSPAYGGVSLGLGRALAALGRYGQAVEQLEDAALEDPDDLTPLLVLGDLHLRHNFCDSAAATFAALRQRAGDAPEILAPLARALEGTGDLDGALEASRCLAASEASTVAQAAVARLEMLQQAHQEAQALAADLGSLVLAIRQGATIPAQTLDHVLARMDLGQRVEANLELARACLERPERYWSEQAGLFADRAWTLSGFADRVLPVRLQALTALGDAQGIGETYKRAGLEAAKRNDVGAALKHFNASQAAAAAHPDAGRDAPDIDVLDCIDRLAEPYRFDRQPANAAAAADHDRIRVVYLLHGVTQSHPAPVSLARQVARHHDRDGFELSVFCSETRSEAMAAASGAGQVRELEEQGCRVYFAAPLSRWEDRLLAIAKAIHAAGTDLLVTSAAPAALDHYFISALRPAAKTLGFIHGATAGFAPPTLDWSIATSRQAQMEAPCGCTLMPPEADPADAAASAAMVRRIEAVCRHVLAQPPRAAPVLAPPLGSDGVSNLGYWQQIQQEGYFESHPCYEGINAFGEDEKVILNYTPLTPDKTVVEIGCGYGRDVLRIAPLCRHVYGIDVNQTILAKAVKFLGERGIGNFTPVLAERWEQDIPEGIDVVFTIVVFQHLTKDMVRNYVAGLARKLAPGGCFICQFAEDVHGSSDAMLKKYEPSVKWTRDEIETLVADTGLELFALDSSQVTPSCTWHWAHFGRPASSRTVTTAC